MSDSFPPQVYELLALADKNWNYDGEIPEHLKVAFDFACTEKLVEPFYPTGFWLTDKGVKALAEWKMRREAKGRGGGSGGAPPISGESDKLEDDVTRTPSELPKSRIIAKAAYDWAMSEIPDAESMTYPELYEAISNHPSDAADGLPPSAETFAKYLRDAGVKRYSLKLAGKQTRSILTENQVQSARQPDSGY